MIVIARMLSSRRSALIGGIRQPGFSVTLKDASTTAATASSTFCTTYQCRLFSGAGGRQKDSKGSCPTRPQLLDEDVEERFVKASVFPDFVMFCGGSSPERGWAARDTAGCTVDHEHGTLRVVRVKYMVSTNRDLL